MIFYFSATGNCRYVAEQLGGDIRSIPQEMRREGELSYKDDAIGIVFPLYGHLMPYMVRQFVERAKFDTPYFFLVATYGRRHANGVELAQREMRKAGVEPVYISTLLMVDNWLPNFDMDAERALVPEKRIDENLSRIRADIAARKQWIEPVTDADRAAHEEFLRFGIAFEPQDLKDFLSIDATACSGCHICERVCPAGCIRVEREVAVRDALAGQGCNACLACIHACPNNAFSLALGEVNRSARFRNEHVSLAQIMEANDTTD